MAGTDDMTTTTTDTPNIPVHQFDTMKDQLTDEPWYNPETGCELLRGWYHEETDRACVVIKHVRMGHFTGYVRTTATLTTDDAMEADTICVHGGVTYASDGWLGFDTAHATDNNQNEEGKPFGRLGDLPWSNEGDVTTWTPEDVYQEAERLADTIFTFEQDHGLPTPGHPEDDAHISTTDPDDPPNDDNTTA